MKKVIRYYSYSSIIYIFIFLVILFIVFLIPLILVPNKSWGLIIPMFIILMYIYYAIQVGMLIPIYLSNEGVNYRYNKYTWDEIRITAYQIMGRSTVKGYILLFDKKYLSMKEIKKAMKKTFYIYLNENIINDILKFYKKEILILDHSGNKDIIQSTKKINFIINEHNKRNSSSVK